MNDISTQPQTGQQLQQKPTPVASRPTVTTSKSAPGATKSTPKSPLQAKVTTSTGDKKSTVQQSREKSKVVASKSTTAASKSNQSSSKSPAEKNEVQLEYTQKSLEPSVTSTPNQKVPQKAGGPSKQAMAGKAKPANTKQASIKKADQNVGIPLTSKPSAGKSTNDNNPTGKSTNDKTPTGKSTNNEEESAKSKQEKKPASAVPKLTPKVDSAPPLKKLGASLETPKTPVKSNTKPSASQTPTAKSKAEVANPKPAFLSPTTEAQDAWTAKRISAHPNDWMFKMKEGDVPEHFVHEPTNEKAPSTPVIRDAYCRWFKAMSWEHVSS